MHLPAAVQLDVAQQHVVASLAMEHVTVADDEDTERLKWRGGHEHVRSATSSAWPVSGFDHERRLSLLESCRAHLRKFCAGNVQRWNHAETEFADHRL